MWCTLQGTGMGPVRGATARGWGCKAATHSQLARRGLQGLRRPASKPAAVQHTETNVGQWMGKRLHTSIPCFNARRSSKRLVGWLAGSLLKAPRAAKVLRPEGPQRVQRTLPPPGVRQAMPECRDSGQLAASCAAHAVSCTPAHIGAAATQPRTQAPF